MFEFQGQMVSGVLNGGLVPFTTYVCSVRAATNGGIGGASDSFSITTQQDG